MSEDVENKLWSSITGFTARAFNWFFTITLIVWRISRLLNSLISFPIDTRKVVIYVGSNSPNRVPTESFSSLFLTFFMISCCSESKYPLVFIVQLMIESRGNAEAFQSVSINEGSIFMQDESKDWYPRTLSKSVDMFVLTPEVLLEHSRGFSLSWSSCSLRSFSTKRQTWQFVLVSKLSYFFIKCRKLFLFAAVFGVDYLSLIIHLLILLEKLQHLCHCSEW